MSASRTLLRRQPRVPDENGHTKRRKKPGEPFRKIIEETNQGRSYSALHATKGYRRRSVPMKTYTQHMAHGGKGLALMWNFLRGFWRRANSGPRSGLRTVRGGRR